MIEWPQQQRRQSVKLYKTTIVIWSERNPATMEIDELASAAVGGDAYCSKQEIETVEAPEKDPDWDGTEFFDNGNDLED